MGILINVVPLYQSELVPVSFRARSVGFTVAGFAGFSVIGTVVVWATEKINDHRQYLIPLATQAAAPVLLFLLSFLMLRESPRWLASKGRLDEARANFELLRGLDVTATNIEFGDILRDLEHHRQITSNVKPWDIFQRKHIERTLTSGALLPVSQISGQILVSQYSTVTLMQSGVADPFKITVIIFLAQFIGTIVGPVFVDRHGRRPVALTAFLVLFAIDVAAGIIACTGLDTNPKRLGIASLSIIFFFFNAASFQSL